MNQTTQERKQREAQILEKRRRTSIHEAGHAVLARAHGLPVREITVRPDATGDCWIDIPARDSVGDIKREIMFDLAGKLAVAIEADQTVRDDALRSILGSEASLDWPGKTGVEGYRRSLERLLGDELTSYRWFDDELPAIALETTAILLERWDEVVSLATELLRKGSIYPEQRGSSGAAPRLVERLKRNKRKRKRLTQDELSECRRFLVDETSSAADRSYVAATLKAWRTEGSTA